MLKEPKRKNFNSTSRWDSSILVKTYFCIFKPFGNQVIKKGVGNAPPASRYPTLWSWWMDIASCPRIHKVQSPCQILHMYIKCLAMRALADRHTDGRDRFYYLGCWQSRKGWPMNLMFPSNRQHLDIILFQKKMYFPDETLKVVYLTYQRWTLIRALPKLIPYC